MKRLTYFILALSLLCGISYAAEPKAVLSIDKREVSPGKQAKILLKVTGVSYIKEPEPPFVNGLDIRYQGSNTTEEGSTIFTYRIVSKKTGNYTIGPVSVEYQGARLVSNTVNLNVTKEAYFAPTIAISSGEADISKRIYLSLELPKKRLYVNEKLPVEIKLFSDWFDLEDITVNEIVTGELLAEKLTKGGSNVINIGDKRFAVLSYNTNIIAPTPGNIAIEPVKASLNIAPRRPAPSGELPPLLNENEIFYKNYLAGRNKVPLELETAPVSLEVLPLPLKNRPDTFSGAVGNFNFEAIVSPLQAKVGDDIKINLSVTGEGNYATFKTIRMPPIPGARPYEPVIKRGLDSFSLEEMVRVVSADMKEVPVITFTYFDPTKGDYVSISKGPFPIRVEAVSPKTLPEAIKNGKIPAETAGISKPKEKKPEGSLIGIKTSIGRISRFNPYLYSGALPFTVQILPILLLFASMVVKNRMNFLETDHEYAAWLRMSKKSVSDIIRAERLFRHRKTKEFYNHVFLTMQDYLGMRLMVPPEGITEKTVGDILGGRITDKALLDKIYRIFADCYMARFTSIELTEDDMKRTLDDLRFVITHLNGRTYLLNI